MGFLFCLGAHDSLVEGIAQLCFSAAVAAYLIHDMVTGRRAERNEAGLLSKWVREVLLKHIEKSNTILDRNTTLLDLLLQKISSEDPGFLADPEEDDEDEREPKRR